MIHFFVIGGITPDNMDTVIADMLLIDGMKQMDPMDDGVCTFISGSSDDSDWIACHVRKAIKGTGAAILNGWL